MKRPSSLEALRELNDSLGLSLPISNDIPLLGNPVRIGSWRAPNRFVALPMEGRDAGPDGEPGDLTFRRYERMAAGGAGIIWFEACAVRQEGRSAPNALFLHESNLARFRDLVDRTRRSAHDAMGHEILCILQLTHSGRYCRPYGKPAPVLVRRCPDLDKAEGLADDYPLLTDDALDNIQDAFVESASLAQDAGFDGVDIKSCHGYLVSSLLGAHLREGKYGGNYEHRTSFLKGTIARTQKQIPSAMVTTRLNAFDGIAYPYGFGTSRDDRGRPDMTEPLRLVKELAEMGLPLLSISMGHPRFDPHYGRPSADAKHEHPLIGIARFSELVRQLQSAVPGIPVVTGALAWLEEHLPQVAAGLIESGAAQLIGQGRNSIAYPDSVRDILENGSCSKDKCCVTCSGCSKLLREGRHVGCIVRDKCIYSSAPTTGRVHGTGSEQGAESSGGPAP
jgi:2,4-dienoyl-CoA reductase-like NADH-dependent reductase (Old Yellow Enzyme family)